MEVYTEIQNAVDYIEEKLGDDIKVDDVANRSGYSSYHFQRIFQAVTGFAFKEYLRKRRLSESVKTLRSSKVSIIHIASNCGYLSQEAYTRAFKAEFGLTPGAVRRGNGEEISTLGKIEIASQELCKMESLHIRKPQIICIDPLSVVGVKYSADLNKDYFSRIADAYEDFGIRKHFERIENRMYPGFPFGIPMEYTSEGAFEFFIGEQVKQVGKLDGELSLCSIRGGRYARFAIDGNLSHVREVWRYIYGRWLENSNYELREDFDFEIINVGRSLLPKRVVMDIFIPVK